MADGLLDPARIVAGRGFKRIARHVDVLGTTTSTNDAVWSVVNEPDADGRVVFAEHQTAGRGRMGRVWCSPRGASVLCSVLLVDSARRPTPPPGSLGLIAGIAAARAVHEAGAVHARISWPNDIVVGDRKLGGVLIESRTLDTGQRIYAVGIGINCLQHRDHFPVELRTRATSLDLESNRPVRRDAVAGELLSALDWWLCDPTRWESGLLKAAFTEAALPLGRSIRVRYEGRVYTGQVIDVDPSAALVVQLDEGGRRLFPAATTTVVGHAAPPHDHGA